MATAQFTAAIAALNALSADELNDLVPHWKMIAKHKRSMQGTMLAVKNEFKYGDILRWTSNKRGRPAHQYMKFENMNRARTCVVGHECDAQGKPIPPTPGKTGKWTVATTFVDQVNGKAITK